MTPRRGPSKACHRPPLANEAHQGPNKPARAFAKDSTSANLSPDRSQREHLWLATLGQRLRLARCRAGMSQEHVASEVGIPARSLTRWEHGESDVGVSKLAKLAQLFGVSMDWLTGRTPLHHCVRPGVVLLDSAALDELVALADARASLCDVPTHLLREPGVSCSVIVPDNAEVVSGAAASRIEARMQEIWRCLHGYAR